MLTQKRLTEVLHYNPTSGIFTWKVRVSNIKAGQEAGSRRKDNYTEIGIDGISYLAHRLAWLYMNGVWPDAQIDHFDLDRNNTRWDNLREANHGQNVHNSRARKHNSTGLKGVTFIKATQKYHARIMANRKLYLLGYFDDPQKAAAAYAAKASELHREFARTQ